VDDVSDKHAEIKVIFYSGYKGRETPRAVVLGGREYPVDAIIWRKKGQDRDTREPYDLFRCRAAGQEFTFRISASGECRLLGRKRLLLPS
jgi:hypothetical protein